MGFVTIITPSAVLSVPPKKEWEGMPGLPPLFPESIELILSEVTREYNSCKIQLDSARGMSGEF